MLNVGASSWLFYTKIIMLWNVWKCSPSDAASYSRRTDSFFKVQNGGNKFLWRTCAYLTETNGVPSQQMVAFKPVLVLKFTKSLTFKWSGWYTLHSCYRASW